MTKLYCSVCIPTRELFSGEIAYARVPGRDGDFGVMAGHEMFVSTNRPGVITLWLDEAGKERIEIATYEGATAVLNGRLSILARMGRKVDDIDVDSVREKRVAMQERIEELSKKEDDVDKALLETCEARLAWYDTQLKIKDAV